jgi:hypothetical protein
LPELVSTQLVSFRTLHAGSEWLETNSETNWARKHATEGERGAGFDLRTDARLRHATPKFESPFRTRLLTRRGGTLLEKHLRSGGNWAIANSGRTASRAPRGQRR